MAQVVIDALKPSRSEEDGKGALLLAFPPRHRFPEMIHKERD
jgi:hypothetical protein